MCNKGKDIHKLTASKMFNVPYHKVTETQRREAKRVNYFPLYAVPGGELLKHSLTKTIRIKNEKTI